jgi:branched-chain amino acid transport system permease protein
MDLGDKLLQLALSGIALGAIYGIVGLGFNIIYSATGVINFAQGELVMLGGLVGASLVVAHVPALLALPAAALVVGLVGMALERLALRPVARGNVMSMITVTIGASVLLRGVAKLVWGPNAVAMPAFSGTSPLHVGSAAMEPQELWVIGAALAVVVLTQLFFTRTLTGKAMRASAMNQAAARLAGVRVERMNMVAFGLSAAMSGLAGVVLTPLTMMSYDSGTHLAVNGFCAAIVGGLGNGAGAVAGGLVLGICESLGAGLISSGYKDAFALLVLVAVLWLRPAGLLGSRTQSGL